MGSTPNTTPGTKLPPLEECFNFSPGPHTGPLLYRTLFSSKVAPLPLCLMFIPEPLSTYHPESQVLEYNRRLQAYDEEITLGGHYGV